MQLAMAESRAMAESQAMAQVQTANDVAAHAHAHSADDGPIRSRSTTPIETPGALDKADTGSSSEKDAGLNSSRKHSKRPSNIVVEIPQRTGHRAQAADTAALAEHRDATPEDFADDAVADQTALMSLDDEEP